MSSIRKFITCILSFLEYAFKGLLIFFIFGFFVMLIAVNMFVKFFYAVTFSSFEVESESVIRSAQSAYAENQDYYEDKSVCFDLNYLFLNGYSDIDLNLYKGSVLVKDGKYILWFANTVRKHYIENELYIEKQGFNSNFSGFVSTKTFEMCGSKKKQGIIYCSKDGCK